MEKTTASIEEAANRIAPYVRCRPATVAGTDPEVVLVRRGIETLDEARTASWNATSTADSTSLEGSKLSLTAYEPYSVSNRQT